jgi:uncharacterized protein YecA (UPF0149 family)
MHSKFSILDYNLSDDTDILDIEQGITPEIKEIMQEVYSEVFDKKKNVQYKLKSLIEQYPSVPQFKNYLSVYYKLIGNDKKADAINNKLLSEHPDYLFGKLAAAEEFINRKQYEKVLEILGKDLDLKLLYPTRNKFHYSELSSFLGTIIRYYIGIKNIEDAESRFIFLKNVDPEYKYIESLNNRIMILRLELASERLEVENEFEMSVKSKSKKVIKSTNKKPDFENSEIEILYQNEFDLEHDFINIILSLPRESLIEDLHKVIYDAIARYSYFRKQTEYKPKTHSFIIHSLFFLTELKSEKSLQVILDILRQNDKFIDYWFSDIITQDFWRIIYSVGFNKLDLLKEFMKEPDIDCYNKGAVSSAVTQICLHNPERKNEIIEWYRELYLYFFEHKNDKRIIDTNVIGFMTGDVLDFNGKELIPEIELLYNHNLASIGFAGDLDEVLKEFENPYLKNKKNKLQNIYEMYEEYSKYSSYEEEDEIPIKEKKEIRTYAKPEYKAGRNEPCPCGSGKKFKKCHGSSIQNLN